MLKLSASLSRKLPVPYLPFASRHFAAGLEVELPDGADPRTLRARLRRMYALLDQAVARQIEADEAALVSPVAGKGTSGDGVEQASGNGSGLASGAPPRQGLARRSASAFASQAQQRCIRALAQDLNLELPALLEEYHVRGLGELSLRDASRLIDQLRLRQAAVSPPA